MEPVPPSIVLAACAEPFLDGSRAVVFGDSSSPLPAELLERGARLVHVYDPIAGRAADAAGKNRSRQTSIAPWDEADVAVREGAFDVAIVPELTAFSDPSKILGLAKRSLSPGGVALVAAPNPEVTSTLVTTEVARVTAEPMGYYALYDVVSAHFPEVKMLGQTPFVGYAIVDFASDGDPDVSIDSDLVPGGSEEPEWFIAWASSEPLHVDAVSIVQIPTAQVVGHRARAASDAGGSDELGAARAAEARLADELGAARAAEARLADELRAARAAETHLIDRVAALELRLAELAARAPEPASPGASPEEVAALQAELADRAAKLRETEGRVEALSSERDGLQAELSAAQARLSEFAGAPAEEGQDEVTRLEATLKERSQELRRLEKDLEHAERIGKDLVLELRRLEGKARPTSGADGPDLALENARLRADLEAAGWTIDELEGRLSGTS